jgi:high-affinity iron transporter
LESALFLISTTVGEEQGAGQLLGGVLGTLAAFAIGYLVYQGGSRLNLRLFFRITGVMIILFAAGLVAKGIHEFEEIDLLPPLIEHVWSLSFADPATSLFWQFMKSLFGWRPDPSLLAVLGYLAYLLPIGWSFLKATATPMTVSQPAPVG